MYMKKIFVYLYVRKAFRFYIFKRCMNEYMKLYNIYTHMYKISRKKIKSAYVIKNDNLYLTGTAFLIVTVINYIDAEFLCVYSVINDSFIMFSWYK